MEEYQRRCDHKLLPRVPIMMVLNGRNFAKTTQLLDKPYCSKLAEALLSTTLKLCTEIEGVFFAYQHNDEIVIALRNDQHPDTRPWYDGSVQKIASVSSALATLHFNRVSDKLELNLSGDAIFTGHVFEVGTMTEAINSFVYKQQANFHSSIQSACLYNLLSKYDRDTIRDMLSGLGIDEKIDLLWQECGVSFNDYPLSFRRGAAVYKVPKIINDAIKEKWHLNAELPIFTKDTSFLHNIFRIGADIFG